MQFLNQINNYWSIILFVLGIIASCVYFKFQVNDIESRLDKLEDKQEENAKSINDISGDIREIKAILLIIKDKVMK